jgi:hypothetical protein
MCEILPEGIVFTPPKTPRVLLRPPVAKRRPPMALRSSGRASLVANACGQVARRPGWRGSATNKPSFKGVNRIY